MVYSCLYMFLYRFQVSLLSSANTILYSMLSSAVTYRTSSGLLYAPAQGEEDPMVEVQPWTTSTGSKGC